MVAITANKKGKTKMNLEKQKTIDELLKIYHSDEDERTRRARLLGMCQAMLTDEQADTMISYLQKWIGEK